MVSFHANNPSWDPAGSKIAFDSDIFQRFTIQINEIWSFIRKYHNQLKAC